MKEFIRKYENRIYGALSCFDRMIFRGYLPIMSGWAMAEFLYRLNVNFGNLKAFLLQNSERVKNHAIAMAKKHGRPFRYLASNIDKDETARQLAARDGIQHGLICIFSILEPCRTFSFLLWGQASHDLSWTQAARQFRRRDRLRSLRLRRPYAGMPNQASCQRELAQDVRQVRSRPSG